MVIVIHNFFHKTIYVRIWIFFKNLNAPQSYCTNVGIFYTYYEVASRTHNRRRDKIVFSGIIVLCMNTHTLSFSSVSLVFSKFCIFFLSPSISLPNFVTSPLDNRNNNSRDNSNIAIAITRVTATARATAKAEPKKEKKTS